MYNIIPTLSGGLERTGWPREGGQGMSSVDVVVSSVRGQDNSLRGPPGPPQLRGLILLAQSEVRWVICNNTTASFISNSKDIYSIN